MTLVLGALGKGSPRDFDSLRLSSILSAPAKHGDPKPQGGKMPTLSIKEVEQIFRTEQSGFDFRFAESESCDITGPGHQDKEQFLGAVKMYDWLRGVEDDEDFVVNHIYASVFKGDYGDLCIAVRDEKHLDTIPIECVPLTIIWGQR